MTRIEAFAAAALTAVLSVRGMTAPNESIAYAWRIADAMEAEARKRDVTAAKAEADRLYPSK